MARMKSLRFAGELARQEVVESTAERAALQRRRSLGRENARADSSFQKTPDLARRQAPSAASACWADVAFQSGMSFQPLEHESGA